MSDEVDFLHADNHESFLQIDTMIFDGDSQAFPRFSGLQCLYNTSEKNYEMNMLFCM